MPALRRGETSSCDTPELDIFFRVGDVLFNVYQLEFVIEDLANPAIPVQVYPLSGRASVDVDNDCPAGGRLSTGRYVAAYTAPLSAVVGTHRIVWYYLPEPTSEEQSWSQEFEILHEAEPSGGDGYVTVAEAQAQGHTATEEELQDAITEASRLIDELTGWWFEPRQLLMTVDGTGDLTLPLHVPCIDITSVHLDGVLVDPGSYVVYNRHVSENSIVPEDDRNFPRLERRWRSDSGLVEDLYYRIGRGVWPVGQRNLQIAGIFGYTDPPGPMGVTPPAIKRACLLLLNTLLIPLGPSGSDDLAEAGNQARLKRLRTRDQEVEYFEGTGGSTGNPTGYLTGDPIVDNILARYMAPPSMGVAQCRFVAV